MSQIKDWGTVEEVVHIAEDNQKVWDKLNATQKQNPGTPKKED